jgi:hypothetical protein
MRLRLAALKSEAQTNTLHHALTVQQTLGLQ